MVLLSSSDPKKRSTQFPMLWHQTGAQESGREHGQETWSKLVKGIFQIIEYHVQCIHWRELAGYYWSLLRDGMGICQWVMNSWIVHHLVFLGFIPLYSFLLSCILFIFIITINNYYYYYISIIKPLYLNLWVLTVFFSLLSSLLEGWGMSERFCGP